eukprot:15458988-Alexandrium_andersonii.AAC.1
MQAPVNTTHALASMHTQHHPSAARARRPSGRSRRGRGRSRGATTADAGQALAGRQLRGHA